MVGAFAMSLNSTCFWLFTPVWSQYFREEVFLSRKYDTAQKADGRGSDAMLCVLNLMKGGR